IGAELLARRAHLLVALPWLGGAAGLCLAVRRPPGQPLLLLLPALHRPVTLPLLLLLALGRPVALPQLAAALGAAIALLPLTPGLGRAVAAPLDIPGRRPLACGARSPLPPRRRARARRAIAFRGAAAGRRHARRCRRAGAAR